MADPRDLSRLHHMAEAARKAIRKVQGLSRADLDAQEDLAAALVWRLTVIGEAAGRVSQEMQDSQPQIPWPQIVAMRNRLVHGYDVIDLDLVWKTLTEDLPPLLTALDAIVSPGQA